jgi:hypothetical protein
MIFKKFLTVLHWTYLALLVLGTVTILLRRLVWEQIPTQISPWVVYLTIAINCCWIVLLLRRWRRTT